MCDTDLVKSGQYCRVSPKHEQEVSSGCVIQLSNVLNLGWKLCYWAQAMLPNVLVQACIAAHITRHGHLRRACHRLLAHRAAPWVYWQSTASR